jgi:hypothetical protein
MAITGSLATMSVPDLLQFLAVGRKTGLLKFSHGKVIKGIYFEDGIIVGSSTNDPTEYFGQVLIHYGKIHEAQLKAAMEVQRKEGHRPTSEAQNPAPGQTQQRAKGEGRSAHHNASANTELHDSAHRRLGQILVAQGILTDAEVVEVLEIRTLDIIYDLFIWKEGYFEFYVEGPLPPDFTRVHVEPNKVVMEGIYRADELARYRTLIPSDRAIMELAAGWTSSLGLGKGTRQLLYFLEKRMSVAEICYNMHASPFEVYAQLYDLVTKGLAHVAGELPEIPDPVSPMANLPEAASDLLLLAREELNNNKAEEALTAIHAVLRREPKNAAAHNLLHEAEKKFIKQVYSEISPSGVPKVVIHAEALTEKDIQPQEGFVLSRINGEWDIQSILSICPFREADSLRMIKKLWDNGIIGF